METVGKAYRKAVGISGDFDAIVIGSGMGGLSVSSILAQQNKRVLLLEQNNVMGGMTQAYSRHGYRWTVGMHYIGEVGSAQSAGWKLFNYVTGGGLRWTPMPRIFNRMVIGERHYEIPAGAEAYGNLLKDHFPHEVEGIDKYMALIGSVAKSSAGYFAQKAMSSEAADGAYDDMCASFHSYSDRLTIDVLSELMSDPELIALICANWGDYSLEPTRSSFAMHCMLAKHYMNGAYYPVGGGMAFSKLMAPIIEDAGGVLLHSAEVSKILVEAGVATGIRLSSGEEVRSPVVISDAGVQNTFSRLVDKQVSREAGLDRLLARVTDTYAVVGLNIGFDRSAEAIGFNPANIWSHPTNDLQANLGAHRDNFDAPFPWIFTTFPSTKDASWGQECPGKATVEMYAYTDYKHFKQWAGTRWMKRGEDYLAIKEKIRERLLEELFRHVPQAREALDYVEVSTPLSYETFAKRERGGFMGIESSPQRFRQKWLRARTPIKGLYITGQDLATDGVIGALVGGVICASAVVDKDLMSHIRAS
ncbi:NAD(P)/FAD-dependent oxidoreductase [Marinobacter sp. NFXS9]|uniref:phytoene desaturase family protein n=1 Tax=Marinobacter sp. NFXS9 TaxID=2818433 RepID=UPI0032DF406A